MIQTKITSKNLNLSKSTEHEIALASAKLSQGLSEPKQVHTATKKIEKRKRRTKRKKISRLKHHLIQEFAA